MKDTDIISVPGNEAFIAMTLATIGQQKIQQGRRYKDETRYKDVVCAFDIETSRYADAEGRYHGFMYHWQFQLGEMLTITGREWETFETLISLLNESCGEKQRYMIYVHNLSYEFHYLQGIHDFGISDVFATDRRDVLRCLWGHCEFRCSYRLSNNSLQGWTKSLRVDHQKIKDFDYSIIRYPWTPLTPEELRYCTDDVVGLVECVETMLSMENDTLYTIPYTSTGYVRRLAKNAINKSCPYYVKGQQDSLEVYDLLREAYRGGDTHANRYYVEAVLDDVYSVDRSSSYPDVMCHCQFPCTSFKKVQATTANMLRYLKAGKALLMVIELTDVDLADKWTGNPYLAYAKCKTTADVALDNGRILSAGYVKTTITDIDLRIIAKQYSFELMNICTLYIADYGYLPQALTDLIKKLYKDKTELKGVKGKEVEYALSKARINSVYGMTVQRVMRTPIEYHADHEEKWTIKPINREEEYAKATKNAFLRYAWGVWVCAWARYRLWEGIQLCSRTGFVYCDTDSIKTLDEIDLSEYNAQRIADAKKSGAWAVDPAGNPHYMGVFEFEEKYNKFVTCGAKRYAYEHADGTIGITIAGVPKKAGAKELAKKGGMYAFTEGLAFTESDKTTAVYNDDDDYIWHSPEGDVHITANVCIVETTYVMTYSADFEELITNLSIYIDNRRADDYNMRW